MRRMSSEEILVATIIVFTFVLISNRFVFAAKVNIKFNICKKNEEKYLLFKYFFCFSPLFLDETR